MLDFGNTLGDDFDRDNLPDKYIERTPPMTNDQIAAIRERCEKSRDNAALAERIEGRSVRGTHHQQAAQDALALLAEVERLRAELKQWPIARQDSASRARLEGEG